MVSCNDASVPNFISSVRRAVHTLSFGKTVEGNYLLVRIDFYTRLDSKINDLDYLFSLLTKFDPVERSISDIASTFNICK